jgi:hypothetical protein
VGQAFARVDPPALSCSTEAGARTKDVRLHLGGMILLLLYILALPSQVFAAPALPGQPCQTEPDTNWSPQEQRLWTERICIGQIADLRNEEEPQRQLSSRFLEMLLLHEQWRGSIPHQGIVIIGAHFEDEIDLTNAAMGVAVWLTEAVFEGPVNLFDARLEKSLVFMNSIFKKGLDLSSISTQSAIALSGSKVTGQLNLNGADIASSLFLGGAEFEEVNLVSAKVGGQLDLDGSKVTGRLILNGADIATDLFMREGAQFADVDLGSARVGGQLELTGVKVTGRLNLNGANIASSLHMGDGAEFAEADLRSAKIGIQANLNGAKVTGELNMNEANIASSLLMDEGAEFAKVDLVGAKIGGQLDLSRSKMTGRLNLNETDIASSLHMGDGAEFAEVNLVSAKIGGQLDLTRAKVTGRLNMNGANIASSLLMGDGAEFAKVDLRGAKVGGQLDLSKARVTGELNMGWAGISYSLLMGDGAEFDGQCFLGFMSVGGNLSIVGSKLDGLDLTGSTIKGELRLFEEKAGQIIWSNDARLVLLNTTVGVIQDSFEAWPKSPAALDLRGFHYQALAGRDWTPAVAQSVSKPEKIMASSPLRDLLDWLQHSEPFSPQPYEQLAHVLKETGDEGLARAILFAARERQRNLAWEERQIWNWLLMTAEAMFIGYGYRTYYCLGWICLFLLLGMFVVRRTGEAQRHALGSGLAFSFDRLLPLAKLREKHYQIDLQSPARQYFYLHQLMGYVLGLFLAGWLGGFLG